MKRRRLTVALGTAMLLAAFSAASYLYYLKQQAAALLAAQPRPEAVERYARIQEAIKTRSPAESPNPPMQDWPPLPESDPDDADILAPLKQAEAVYARVYEQIKASGGSDELYKELFSRPVSQWSAADWDRLNAFLAEYADLLAEIRAMAAGSGPLYPLDLSQGYATLLPHLAPTRELARLLQASAIARGHAGDFAGAAEDILAGLQLGGRLQEEPVMISQLVNVAINSIMCETIAVAFPEGQIPDALAAELARQFHGNDFSESCLASARGEQGFGLDFMTQITESGWRDNGELVDLLVNGNGVANTWGLHLYATPLARPWQYLDMQTYGQIMDEYEATFSMPYYEAREVLDGIEREVDELPFTRVFTRALIPSVLSMHQAIARTEAQQQLLLLGVALESHANEHGACPRNLNDVLDQANGASTIDPFTGTPFHYAPAENGFELYSVGRDLDDDGGRHDFNDGDIVWRGTTAPKAAAANLVARGR